VAKALHYDRESWLSYTQLRIDGGLVPLLKEKDTVNATANVADGDHFAMASEAHGAPVPVTYTMQVNDGEQKRRN